MKTLCIILLLGAGCKEPVTGLKNIGHVIKVIPSGPEYSQVETDSGYVYRILGSANLRIGVSAMVELRGGEPDRLYIDGHSYLISN